MIEQVQVTESDSDVDQADAVETGIAIAQVDVTGVDVYLP